MKSIWFKKSGFTLVESLVYVAIFAVFFTVIIQFVLSVGEGNQVASIRRDLGNNIIYVSNHIQNSFKNSNSINSSQSVFNSSNGKIRLENGTNYYEYSISNNKLNFNGNGTSFLITIDDVTITNFYIEEVKDRANNLIGLRITIDLVSSKRTNTDLSSTNVYLL